MKWYLKCLKKYAVFSGRASRIEFWMFFLIYTIISFLLGMVAGLLGMFTGSKLLGNIDNIYLLGTLIPSLAVSWRRMHDINRSGWWSIFPLVGLVLSAWKGTKGKNRFGPEPRESLGN